MTPPPRPPAKTNAARRLDTLSIPYRLIPYDVDETDLSATTVASKIGLPPEQVFKTLLTQTSTGDHIFAILPDSAELDLKKLARDANVRKADLAPLAQVEPLTGYLRGGVTVLGASKPFPTLANETIQIFDRISVSAGQRGLQLLLPPADYLRATGATLHDLTRPTTP